MRFHILRGVVSPRSDRTWQGLARILIFLSFGLFADIAHANILVFTFEFPEGVGQANDGNADNVYSLEKSSSSQNVFSRGAVAPPQGTDIGGRSSTFPGRESFSLTGSAGGGGSGSGSGISNGGFGSSLNASGPSHTDLLGGLNSLTGSFDSSGSGHDVFIPPGDNYLGVGPTMPEGMSVLSFGNSLESNRGQAGSLDATDPMAVTPEPFSAIIWTILGLLSSATLWWRGLIGRPRSSFCKR